MKNILNQDLLREIKHTRSRFLSLFLLVAISVAFLAGLRTTQPAMTTSADDYLDSTHLMDVRIVSTLGLTDEDLEVLADLEQVSYAQGAWQVDALVSSEDVSLVVKTLSLSEDGLNQPYLLEGRLPQAQDECVVEEGLLDSLGLSIGDTLSFDTGAQDQEDTLCQTTFVVVGTCTSPLYISSQKGTSSLGTGSVSAIVYLPSSAYNLDYYTDIYLTLEGALELNAFTSSYKTLVESFTSSLEDMAQERALLRTAQLRQEAQDTLDQAEAEYLDAKEEAEEALAEAALQLLEARTTLDEGWLAYAEGLATLETETAQAQEQLAQAEETLLVSYESLLDGESAYSQGESQLAEAQAQYAQGVSQYEAGLATYLENEVLYQAGLAQYEAGWSQYQEGVALYESGLSQYQESLATYQAEKASYENQLMAYQSSLSQYQTSLATYEAALSQWESAWTALVEMGLEDTEDGLALQEKKKVLDATAEQLSALGEQLDQAALDLATAEAVLEAFSLTLADTKAQLDAAAEELEITASTLSSTKTLLDATASTLSSAWAELQASKGTLELGNASIQASLVTLQDTRAELDAGWEAYTTGWETLSLTKASLATSLEAAQSTLADTLATLTAGEASYSSSLTSYQQAETQTQQELEEAQQQLAEGQESIDAISSCTWYVLDRSTNLGFAGYENDAQNMGNLAAIFPLIFFLVAALVCLTTMTRMVEEQRTTIGGLKAMGYSKVAIARKYVGYGLLASLGGSLVGLLLGCTLIPWIIISCWQIMYSIPEIKFAFCPGMYLFSAGAAVVVIVGTVLSATLTTLRATPATLMRPKTPKAGKRVLLEHITPLWNRLSFTKKVTFRNLFRYKKRFWMTIIGISGCAALIVTGFGLRDSINNVLVIQYDQLNLYDATAVVEESNQETLEAFLESNDLVADYAVVHQGTVDFEGDSTISGYYMVYDDADSIASFMVFRDRLTEEPVELTDSGLFISEKLSELLDLQVGDSLILSGDERVTATVAGIVENHVYNYVYMTQAYYQTLYGETAPHNEVLLSYVEDTTQTEEAVSEALLEEGLISSISQISAMRASLNESFEVINYAVLVVIVSAAALAFVVLFNLSNINITERKRELATLKVLGFNNRELSDYVLRENILLTALGILLGMVLGKWLHAFLVRTVEVEMVMFARSAEPQSYLCAALLTALFAVIVNILASRSLRKIDMVESLKSIE